GTSPHSGDGIIQRCMSFMPSRGSSWSIPQGVGCVGNRHRSKSVPPRPSWGYDEIQLDVEILRSRTSSITVKNVEEKEKEDPEFEERQLIVEFHQASSQQALDDLKKSRKAVVAASMVWA